MNLLLVLFSVITTALPGGRACVNVETVAFGATVWEFRDGERITSNWTLVAGPGTHKMCGYGDSFTVKADAEIIARAWLPTSEPRTPILPPRPPEFRVFIPIMR